MNNTILYALSVYFFIGFIVALVDFLITKRDLKKVNLPFVFWTQCKMFLFVVLLWPLLLDILTARPWAKHIK